MKTPKPFSSHGLGTALCAVSCLGLAAAADAEEFAGFKLYPVQGTVTAGYHKDSLEQERPDFASSQSQRGWRGELALRSGGYVYHPNLLSFDVTGGYVASGQVSNLDQLTGQATDGRFNFSVKARVLPEKPVYGSFFYENVNNPAAVSALETFSQHNLRYGASVGATRDALPVALRMEVQHAQQQGRSVSRVVNDEGNDLWIRAERAFNGSGTAQLAYHVRRQESASGSVMQPIVSTRHEGEDLTLDGRFRLGERAQHALNSYLSLTRQQYDGLTTGQPQSRNQRALFSYVGEITQSARGHAQYQTSRTEQGDRFTNSSVAAANLSWTATDRLGLQAGLRGQSQAASEWTQRQLGADAGLQYRRDLGWGRLQLGYSQRVDQREQSTFSAQPWVYGESLTLTLTTPAVLARSLVALATVKVFNATRSQQYVSGLDYRLSVEGTRTRVERLLGGAIGDGEAVLVDYRFDYGGTYSQRDQGQNLNVEWDIGRAWVMYARLSRDTPTLLSGQPVVPLNPVRDLIYGLRFEHSLGQSSGLSAGAQWERERRDELILPLNRREAEVHIQGDLALLGDWNYRLARRRVVSTGVMVQQEVDLTADQLAIGWHHGSGWSVRADLSREHDIGGIESKFRLRSALNAQWRYRKLTLRIAAVRTHEVQGGLKVDRYSGHLALQRDISP